LVVQHRRKRPRQQHKGARMMASSASRADWVADELRRAIIAREFEPGERLAAATLAKRFQVSQTPLREAFARLAGEGWVSYLPQRGVRVAEVSVSDMLEIYELRELLEPLAIRRSAKQGDEAWRELVQVSFDELLALAGSGPEDLASGTYDAYEQAHTHFHRVLLQECGSQWMIRVTAMLSDQSSRFRRLSLPYRSQLGSVNDEHQLLYEAVRAGNADAAAEAALVHMQNTRLAILDWLEPSGPDVVEVTEVVDMTEITDITDGAEPAEH
jgi:DNA-binding GntR family transcriptional regulator